jgi:hypothetical protein
VDTSLSAMNLVTTRQKGWKDTAVTEEFYIIEPQILILCFKELVGKYEGRCKVRGLAAVRRCYAEGGGDC